MNYGGLKQAAHRCLKDSTARPRLLTLFFLLCSFAVIVPCDLAEFVLNRQIAGLSGLSAAASRSRYLLAGYVLVIAVSVATAFWKVGYSAFALRLSRGERVSFGAFCTGFRRFDRVLVLLLLKALYTFLWSQLFLVPGIIAAYRYRVAVFVLLDNPDISPAQAIRVSKRLTYGHKLELFFLDVSFLWYYLPTILTSALAFLYVQGLFPWLPEPGGGLLVDALQLLLPSVMQLFFMAYVETTSAHAYNWLQRLDREQRAALANPRG